MYLSIASRAIFSNADPVPRKFNRQVSAATSCDLNRRWSMIYIYRVKLVF